MKGTWSQQRKQGERGHVLRPESSPQLCLDTLRGSLEGLQYFIFGCWAVVLVHVTQSWYWLGDKSKLAATCGSWMNDRLSSTTTNIC